MIETSTVLLFTGLGLILYSFYRWATENDDFFEKNGVPYLKPNFVFGNTWMFFFNKIPLTEFVEYLYNAHPTAKLSGFFNFMTPIYLIRDPEILKHISIKEFDSFEDHKFIIDSEVDSLFGQTLFLMKGEKWRDMRTTLSPAFTGSKMRLMFELLRECVGDTMQYFQDVNSERKAFSVEMVDVFGRSGIDVISSCAFGLKINSFVDKNNEFYRIGKKVSNLTTFKAYVKFLAQRVVPGVMKFFRIEYLDTDVKRFFSEMVLKNIQTRRKEKIFRPDMIDLLMKAKSGELSHQEEKETLIDGFATAVESNVNKSKVSRNWTDDELVSQTFVFFLAGYDTVTQVMTAFLYQMVLNPDIQQKLTEEIHETEKSLNGKDITYEILQKMRYMDMVTSEVLRIGGPAVFIDRLCTKNVDLLIDGRVIKFKKAHNYGLPCTPTTTIH
ncbi:hypothetical protein HA402_007422 [Bradysia odoriphaga]|nr:hypothetical protein HA402_007422 [Bradysia odoriphaga]